MMKRVKLVDLLVLGVCLTASIASIVWLRGDNQLETQTRRRRLHSPSLQLGESSHTFKILQLADMHFGEDSWTDWGPQQDVNTFKVLESVIPAEKPDLIVLSGDQLTSNNIDKNATDVYRKICDHLKGYGIPWAMIFGNHDDAPLERPVENETTSLLGNLTSALKQLTGQKGGKLKLTPAKTSRRDLYEVDHSFAPLSLTELGPYHLFGTSNYVLDVHFGGERRSADEVALQLHFFDSGGGSLPMKLESNQARWFKQNRKKGIPMIVFQHIPTTEFVYKDDECKGLHDEKVDHIKSDVHFVDVLAQEDDVLFLAVGHNHGNDYCCSYKSMHLCYGRHTGYGGYGSWERGARVYEIQIGGGKKKLRDDGNETEKEDEGGSDEATDLDEEVDSEQTVQWKSWVRMESGDILDEYNPFKEEEEDKGYFGDW